MWTEREPFTTLNYDKHHTNTKKVPPHKEYNFPDIIQSRYPSTLNQLEWNVGGDYNYIKPLCS